MCIGLHVKYQLFASDSQKKKTWIFSTDFRKTSQISNFIKNQLVVAEIFHSDRQTDRPTDKKTLIVVFRNFANALKNRLLQARSVGGDKRPMKYDVILDTSWKQYTVWETGWSNFENTDIEVKSVDDIAPLFRTSYSLIPEGKTMASPFLLEESLPKHLHELSDEMHFSACQRLLYNNCIYGCHWTLNY
jgi:hypothetical protein